MYQIDNSTAVSSMPTPGAAGPKPDSFFISPNMTLGVPGTVMDADWCNAVQMEIINVLSAADITPSKILQDQLITAINAIIAAAIATNNFSWTTIDSDQTLLPRNGYVTNSGATTLHLTLPVSCAEGAIFKVVRFNGNFQINQNDSQQIWYGANATTQGVDGYITPTGNNASVDLLCVVANTTFVVVNSQGAFSVY